MFSVFRLTHRILKESEGYNDGLVSVASSRWGGEQGYKGTLVGVSHLDLINWSNRLKWLAGEITGNRRRYAYRYSYWIETDRCRFNAIAFYLDIAGKNAYSRVLVSIQTADCGCRHAGQGGTIGIVMPALGLLRYPIKSISDLNIKFFICYYCMY